MPSQSIPGLTYIFKKMNLALLKTLINNIRAERFDTPEKTFSSIKEPEGLRLVWKVFIRQSHPNEME